MHCNVGFTMVYLRKSKELVGVAYLHTWNQKHVCLDDSHNIILYIDIDDFERKTNISLRNSTIFVQHYWNRKENQWKLRIPEGKPINP